MSELLNGIKIYQRNIEAVLDFSKYEFVSIIFLCENNDDLEFIHKLKDLQRKWRSSRFMTTVFISKHSSQDSFTSFVSERGSELFHLEYKDRLIELICKDYSVACTPSMLVFNKDSELVSRTGVEDLEKYSSENIEKFWRECAVKNVVLLKQSKLAALGFDCMKAVLQMQFSERLIGKTQTALANRDYSQAIGLFNSFSKDIKENALKLQSTLDDMKTLLQNANNN